METTLGNKLKVSGSMNKDVIAHVGCKTCKQPFVGRAHALFCSDKCRSKHHRFEDRTIRENARKFGIEQDLLDGVRPGDAIETTDKPKEDYAVLVPTYNDDGEVEVEVLEPLKVWTCPNTRDVYLQKPAHRLVAEFPWDGEILSTRGRIAAVVPLDLAEEDLLSLIHVVGISYVEMKRRKELGLIRTVTT
jgi:hypothetical protein